MNKNLERKHRQHMHYLYFRVLEKEKSGQQNKYFLQCFLTWWGNFFFCLLLILFWLLENKEQQGNEMAQTSARSFSSRYCVQWGSDYIPFQDDKKGDIWLWWQAEFACAHFWPLCNEQVLRETPVFKCPLTHCSFLDWTGLLCVVCQPPPDAWIVAICPKLGFSLDKL